MKDESGPPAPSVEASNRGYDSRPIPDRLLAIFLAALVVALVLGYLFVNKLVDIRARRTVRWLIAKTAGPANCRPVAGQTPYTFGRLTIGGTEDSCHSCARSDAWDSAPKTGNGQQVR